MLRTPSATLEENSNYNLHVLVFSKCEFCVVTRTCWLHLLCAASPTIGSIFLGTEIGMGGQETQARGNAQCLERCNARLHNLIVVLLVNMSTFSRAR